MSKLNWSEKGLEDSDLLLKLYDVRNYSQYAVLDLSFNKLTFLSDLRAFRQFDNLKLLDLRYNNISHIDFSLIPPTVTQFSLSDNKLTSVWGLSHCTNLECLDIQSNQVTEVDWRNLPPALTQLHLDGNQLTTVGDVSQCTRLSVLWVQSNHISHIDWRNLPSKLTQFRLSKNQLTTVDLFHCTQLEFLDLSDNPALHSIQSLPNKHFDFSIDSNVKILGRKCFHEDTYSMLKKKGRTWQLEQPPIEVLLQGLETVLEYYKLHSIRTTHTR